MASYVSGQQPPGDGGYLERIATSKHVPRDLPLRSSLRLGQCFRGDTMKARQRIANAIYDPDELNTIRIAFDGA
jgi:hypothetical protein